jgi:hypothetical protein
MDKFTVGQKLIGTGMNDAGLDFEVMEVEPVVKVKCLSINEFWRNIPLKPFPAPSPHVERMWTPGMVYELREVSSKFDLEARGYACYVSVDFRMPWHCFLTNGQVMYYR